MTWIKRRTPLKRSATKYGAKKVEASGIRFDSQLERSHYALLELRQKAGEIANLRTQVKVYLTRARIMYIADAAYELSDTGETEYSEAKGFETSDWRLKRRLWKCYGPGVLQIWKGTAARPFLHETIIPKAEAEAEE